MAKKQTRRSISVSRTTYERLKAFCETNNISMSQLVETRVNDFLGGDAPVQLPSAPAPTMSHGHGHGISHAPSPFRPVASSMSSSFAPRPVVSAPPARPIDARPVIEARPAPVTPSHTVAATFAPAPVAAPVTGVTSAVAPAPQPALQSQAVPMTSAAARFAVEPPPPIIKPRQDTAAPKPAEKRPEQIFTF